MKTQETIDLLTMDLCARIPFGVRVLHEGWNYEWDQELHTLERVTGYDGEFFTTKVIDTHNGEEYREDRHSVEGLGKPFLRRIADMTKEEVNELIDILNRHAGGRTITRENFELTSSGTLWFTNMKEYECVSEKLMHVVIDYLNKHHFDYRGLIPQALAIAVTEEYNPYKIQRQS